MPSPYVFFLSKKGLCNIAIDPRGGQRVDIGDAHDSSSLRQSLGHLLQKLQRRVRRGNPINVHLSCAAFQIVKEIAVFSFSDVDKASLQRFVRLVLTLLIAELECGVAHPLGDFTFRRVPSDARQTDLIIHQLKYPHDDADLDINVIFPIERLQDLATEGVIGGLTRRFFSFIGYNMDPERFEATVAEGIARAVDEEERADVALLAPA